jgi:ribosomal protein S18 acetylase RimI-like enzyme
MLPPLRRLDPEEWHRLRDVRLVALKDSPGAFLATYEQEQGYSQERWEAEFARGAWYISEDVGKPVSMAGVTREPGGLQPAERNLEYVWVAPEHRRSRVAYQMLDEILQESKESGISTVFLHVLDGNEPALLLYKRLNFETFGPWQPLPDDPAGRGEQQFRLELR